MKYNEIRFVEQRNEHARSALCLFSRLIASLAIKPDMPSVKGAGCAVVFYLGTTCVSFAADAAPPLGPAAPPLTTYSTVTFAGIDARDRSYYGYAGLIHALNGNLGTDGFLFRTMGLYNRYDYSSSAVVGGNVDGRMSAFDVLFGYQKYYEGFVGRAYIGLDYERHRLSPDNPFDSNRGSAFGVKVRGEVETLYNSPFYGSLLASYGSARERYWVRGRVGHNFQGVIFGPEGVATGNPETDEQRIGAFVIFRNPLTPVELSASAGYSNTDGNRGGSSAYGTLEISVAF
jgi:hypothetical protein